MFWIKEVFRIVLSKPKPCPIDSIPRRSIMLPDIKTTHFGAGRNLLNNKSNNAEINIIVKIQMFIF